MHIEKMNKYIILILFLVSNLYAGQVSSLSNGLVLLLHMNENANTGIYNSIQNSITSGTITGASWVTGKFGNALSFDGNDYVTILDDPSFDLINGYTFMVWIYPTTLGAANQIINQWATAGTGWQFVLSGAYLAITNRDGTSSSVIDNTTKLTTNKWYCICGVYTGGTAGLNGFLYVNGKLVKSGTLSKTPAASSSRVCIGYEPSTFYFIGIMDEIAIWNRGLSHGEIQYLYNQGVGKCSYIEQ